MTCSTEKPVHTILTIDINNDNQVDVIFESSAKNFNMLSNKGDGTFYDPITYSTEVPDSFLEIGDINNDKKIDIVVGSLVDKTISVHFNNGDGTFTSPIFFSISLNLEIAKAIDINNDDKMGFVVIGGSFDFYMCILLIDC